MVDIAEIIALIRIGLFFIPIVLALVYSVPLLVVRRFHHRINSLTLNICLAIICIAMYWISFFFLLQYYREHLFSQRSCWIVFYSQAVNSYSAPFAFVTITIHRFLSIVYPTNGTFKSKQFLAFCIFIQWITVFIVAIPYAIHVLPSCGIESWLPIYNVFAAIVIPALISFSLNIRLFTYIYRSSRKIQSHNSISRTQATETVRQPKLRRLDIVLLKNALFLFMIFTFGWSPIFLLVAIDYHGHMSPVYYSVFQGLAAISLSFCMINLFVYNQELRHFLKNKIFCC